MFRISRVGLLELRQRQPATVMSTVQTDLNRDQSGVIPGAVIWTEPDRKMATPNLPPDADVVVCCACPNDASAALVARQFQNAGLVNVRPLHGGIDAWTAAVFAVDFPHRPAATDQPSVK